MSTRLLKRRLGQVGPAIFGRKVKSQGSYILIYSLFWTFMASWIIFNCELHNDLWTLVNLGKGTCWKSKLG